MKLPKPDSFYGKPREDVNAWLFSLDIYFGAETQPPADTTKVMFASGLFKGNALAWWINVHHSDAAIAAVDPNLSVTNSWERFKARVKSYFSPEDAVRANRDRLHTLSQTKSVADYTYAFNKLIANIPAISSDELIHAYVRGLKPAVRIEVELRAPETVELAQRIATRVDEIIYAARPRTKAPYTDRRPGPSSSGPTPMELGYIGVAQHGYRGQPGRPGDRSSGAPHPRGKLTETDKAKLRAGGLCFYCKKPGHIAVACPEKTKARRTDTKRLTLADLLKSTAPDAKPGQSRTAAAEN